MFLILLLIAGLSGGIIACFSLVYRIIYFFCGKRRLKTRAQMAAELAGYEGTPTAEPEITESAISERDISEPNEPHPDDIEQTEINAAAEQIAAAAATVPDMERIDYINNILSNIERIKEERELINVAAEQYRTAVLLYPELDISAVTALPMRSAVPTEEKTEPKKSVPKKCKEFEIKEL